MSYQWSNLVKIIPEPSATCKSMFKVIRSKTEIAITPPQTDRLQQYAANVQGQRSRSQHKIMYQQQKHYNTAMDKFSDFKLSTAS